MTSLQLVATAQDAVPGAIAVLVTLGTATVVAAQTLSGPSVRRRHVRLPETTAAEAERLARATTATGRTAVAVNVVPGGVVAESAGLNPSEYGADLDVLLGPDHPVSAPGRHRRPGIGRHLHRGGARRPRPDGDPPAAPAPPVREAAPVPPAERPAPAAAAWADGDWDDQWRDGWVAADGQWWGSVPPAAAPDRDPAHGRFLAGDTDEIPAPAAWDAYGYGDEPAPGEDESPFGTPYDATPDMPPAAPAPPAPPVIEYADPVPLLPPDPVHVRAAQPPPAPVHAQRLSPPDPALDLTPPVRGPGRRPDAPADEPRPDAAARRPAAAPHPAPWTDPIWAGHPDHPDHPARRRPVDVEPAAPRPLALPEPAVDGPDGSPAAQAAVGMGFLEGAAAARLPQQWGGRSPSPTQRRRLRAASRRFAECTDRVGVAQVAAEEAVDLAGGEWGALVVRSVEGPRVLWLHPGGPNGEAVWGHSTLTALLSLGVPFRDLLPGDPLAGGTTTALLAVPVPSAGLMAGSLLVRRNLPLPFSPAEEDVLTRLARMTGKALLTIGLRGGVDQAAGTDAVTGFADRGRLRHDLSAALRTASNHGMPSALLVAQVDGLTRVRAELGSRPADESLTVAAQAVVRSLRVGDVPYRLGADQLAILLPATAVDDAVAVGTRLGKAVQEALSLSDLHPAAGTLRLLTTPVDVTGGVDGVLERAASALIEQNTATPPPSRPARPAVTF